MSAALANTPEILAKQAFISDMDGVIYHGNRLLPGAKAFVEWLQANGKKYLFLTNASERTPRELREKLRRLGLDVPEDHFYTSALSTAAFLKSQCPQGTGVYAIGEAGLANALYDVGMTMNDVDPEYVVVGETRSYNYEKVEKAVRLVLRGARLIGANPDMTGPVEDGIVPANGALISPIELATGVKAYFVGKPNPLMMRNGLKRLGCRREDAIIFGDRMDTDILAGIEAEIDTALVLSGVTARENLKAFAYRPTYIFEGLFELFGN